MNPKWLALPLMLATAGIVYIALDRMAWEWKESRPEPKAFVPPPKKELPTPPELAPVPLQTPVYPWETSTRK